MRTFLIGCAAALVVTGTAHAELQEHWARHHNGSGNSEDYGYGVAVDAAKNTYITGSATNALGVSEVLLVKYNPAGHKVWTRTWAGPGGGPDYGNKVAIDPTGNIVVGADTLGIGTDYDLTTLEYDPDGNLLWARRFNGTGNGYDGMGGGWSLAIGSAGEVFIGGYTFDAVNSFDSLILKYDTNGTLLWQATYDGEEHLLDDNYGLVLDASGDVYAGAETTSTEKGRNILALKYDGASGNLLWEVGYDSPPAASADSVNAIDIDASANVYVVGFGPDSGTGDDMVTMKVDTDGVLQWVRRYDGPANRDDRPWDVAVSPAGLVVVAGFSNNRWESSATTVAYDTLGNLVFVQRFESASVYYGDDEIFDVELDAAGNIWMTGSGWNGPEHGHDTFLLEYAPDGTPLFQDVHDGTGHADDTGFGLAIRGNNVWVGGLSQRGERRVDTLVMRYGPALQDFGPPVPFGTSSALSGDDDDSSLPATVEPRPYRPAAGTPGRPDRRLRAGSSPM